jgi:lipopolysaccharide export system protein LptC
MSVELHLPDLPEVPIALGPARGGAAPRPRQPWHWRWRDRVAAYLPLLLMTLLASFTWWLVKNSPVPSGAAEAPAVRHEPDYTMTQFALERFDAAGRLALRIEGATLRHFPDTDRVEVDDVRIRSIAPDGRVTLASARRAISNGDASELQLIGGARVTSQGVAGGTLEMDGEFLQANLVTERVHSPLPVHVQVDGADLHAAGLDYDQGRRLLELKGPMRAVFDAPAPRR